MFKNDATDQQFNLEAAIKNVDKMSNELKKLNGNFEVISQLNRKMLRNCLKECAVMNGSCFLCHRAFFNVMKQ